MSENLYFTSFVGEQPWFFVPDTGTPGGTAVVDGPSGTKEVTETQTTTGENSSFGPRVGFRVPTPFKKVGEYTMTVTQDKAVTTYVIDVIDRPDSPEALKAKIAELETQLAGLEG